MIYNKREYKEYVRSLFADATAEEFENFEREIKDSDKKRKELQKQINTIIQQFRDNPDETTRKILNNKLETLRADRSVILPSGELIITRFSVLSPEAKKYACTSALLNKYLTQEIVQNNPLKFPTHANGDIIIDFDRLKESHLHELAVDIRDFVHNYMDDNPQLVKHPNYFVQVYTSVPTIYDLNHSIDKYYDRKRENLNDYTASRKGIHIIESYPRQKLHLVRMMTPDALNFESDCMGHCIRRDRYIEKIDTTAEYYSLRSSDPSQPFYPYVTMFFDEGKLVEIVGKANHAISGMARVKLIRDYIKRRFNLESEKDLISADKVPHVDDRRFGIALRNLGLIPDKNGVYHDLYNLPHNQVIEFESCPVTARNLDYINKQSISAKSLWLQGDHGPHIIDKINQFHHIDTLTFAVQYNYGDIQELDLSKLRGVKKLVLSSANLRKIKKIIFPKDIEQLEMWSVDFSNIKDIDLMHCLDLKKVSFRNSDLRKTSTIKFPPSINEIDFSYVKSTAQMGKRLERLQKILTYKRKFYQALKLDKLSNMFRTIKEYGKSLY